MPSKSKASIVDARVIAHREEGGGLHVLTVESQPIAASIQPGQFLNVRITEGVQPLLRRPFSVSRVAGSQLEIVFNIVGVGTNILAAKRPGETLDMIGPLGVPFSWESEFQTALIVAGGLGVAPFPFFTGKILDRGKSVETFLGARTASQLFTANLRNVHYATDDGSRGFHGTAVSLLEHYVKEHPIAGGKIFACGPTKMLKALSEFAQRQSIPCELSLEGDMACGIGICQGCPVEKTNGPKKYALVCTDGPAFDCKDVILP